MREHLLDFLDIFLYEEEGSLNILYSNMVGKLFIFYLIIIYTEESLYNDEWYSEYSDRVLW